MTDTPMSGDVCPKLRRISEKARQDPLTRFLSLAHLMTEEMLLTSFRQLKKNAAAGIDGVTWHEYEVDARARIASLHKRLCESRYRAQPVRRVYIEKEDGSQRPLGIPALEDKIVQRAVVTILEAIYEQDFHPFSYGLRPGKSAQDALDALNREFFPVRVRHVIDADIKGYFDSVVHSNLMEFLRGRIADGSLLRLVSKWLHAGVLEDGRLLVNQMGTPQGAIISPLLANVYLHYVLDEWWVKDVLPRLKGHAVLIRYADDFVMGFANQEDAERVMRVLGKRFDRFGLILHESKTRLLPFNYKETEKSREGTAARPTFNFLGFTHFFGRSRTGMLTYRVRTMAKRLVRAVKSVTKWCREHRHWSIEDQRTMLAHKLLGHYNYYGRSHNYHSLLRYYKSVKWAWFKWLRRRGNRRLLTYETFRRLLKVHPLPFPRITRRFSPT